MAEETEKHSAKKKMSSSTTSNSQQENADTANKSVVSGGLCCTPHTPFAAEQRLRKYRFTNCEAVPDMQVDALFGTQVAISNDGTVLVISAPLYDVVNTDDEVISENNGAVYVFERSVSHGLCDKGTKYGKWLFRQRLVQQSPKTCATELQENVEEPIAFNFGHSIAVSRDGFYIVVGAPQQIMQNSDGVDEKVGAVYVFARCPRQKGHWVAVDKLRAQQIVRADDACDECEEDDEAYDGKYQIVSDAQENSFFGFSVDISLDGGTIIVGAPFYMPQGQGSTGAVYLYRRQCSIGLSNVNATFSRRCNKSHTLYAMRQRIVSPVEGSEFGFSVALSEFGDFAAIGKPNMTLGSSITFAAEGCVTLVELHNASCQFNFLQDLVAEPIMTGAMFGTGVRVTPDKRFVLVDSPGEDKIVENVGGSIDLDQVGTVYVFERRETKATRCCAKKVFYELVARLCPSFDKQGDEPVTDVEQKLGEMTSFAVSDSGCVVAVGYETLDQGTSFEGPGNGAVIVYRYDACAGTWLQAETLRAFNETTLQPALDQEGLYFGASVAMSGDGCTLVVGESKDEQEEGTETFAYSYTSKCKAYSGLLRKETVYKRAKKGCRGQFGCRK